MSDLIQSHPSWLYCGVYADGALTGTKETRENFQRLLSDCRAGKIDIVITKSISRFARNTVTLLRSVRELKDLGIDVFFEKENIYTFDGKGELLLTIMSSLAQEESRSISENVTWGQRKGFSDGKVNLPYKNFIGYDRCESKDDPPVINLEQAEIVREIYSSFMHGKTAITVAKQLTERGIKTPSGKNKWDARTIKSILLNEKYRGSARLQKKFTVDFLTKKSKNNEGEVPQYYVENSHEAIIAPEEWDAVQDEIERRKKIGRAYSGKNVMGCKIICGDCGAYFGSKTWHGADKYKTVIWQCNSKFDKTKKKCSTPHLKEEEIKERFLKVFNKMIENKAEYIGAAVEVCKTVCGTAAIDSEMDDLKQELEVVTEMTKKFINENAKEAQDQDSYTNRYNSLVERYDKAKSRYDELK